MGNRQSNKRTKPWGLFITKTVTKSTVEDPDKYLDELGIRSTIIGDTDTHFVLYAWHFKAAAQALIKDHGFTFCEAGQMPS